MTIRSYKDHTPAIGDNTYIDDSAIVIGDVVIGNDVSVWPLTVIRGDVIAFTLATTPIFRMALFYMLLTTARMITTVVVMRLTSVIILPLAIMLFCMAALLEITV